MLFPMVVLVAGCLPRPAPDLPASFLAEFNGRNGNPTFTVLPPPAGETGQDAVAAVRADDPSSVPPGRAVPVFGRIDCTGDPGCWPRRGADREIAARTVWLVLFPDCLPDRRGIGWALVDAVNGVDGGYMAWPACDP